MFCLSMVEIATTTQEKKSVVLINIKLLKTFFYFRKNAVEIQKK